MHRDLDEYAKREEHEKSASESDNGAENEFDKESRDYRRLAPF